MTEPFKPHISPFKPGGMRRVALTQTWDGKNKGGPLCRASVHDGYGVGFHQCTQPGKVQDDGGFWWCRIHSPEAVAKRKAEAQERRHQHMLRWQAADRRAEERARRERAYPDLEVALKAIAAGHNDPRSLAAEVLAKHAPKTESPDA